MSGIIDKNGYSQTYKTMCEYVNDLKDVANSPGYLTNNFKSVSKQIDIINNMVNNMKDVALTSIKQDLIDIMNKSVDWNKYKDDLITFIKDVKHNKLTPKFSRQKFYSFKFKYNDTWCPLNDDELNNMFMIVSDMNENDKNIDKKINMYEDVKDTFVNELDEFINNLSSWEDNVVECRTNNIPLLIQNINSLYEIHKKYVYEKLKKLPSSFEREVDGKLVDCIMFKNVVIPLDKSQPKFIKNAIKIMLNI